MARGGRRRYTRRGWAAPNCRQAARGHWAEPRPREPRGRLSLRRSRSRRGSDEILSSDSIFLTLPSPRRYTHPSPSPSSRWLVFSIPRTRHDLRLSIQDLALGEESVCCTGGIAAPRSGQPPSSSRTLAIPVVTATVPVSQTLARPSQQRDSRSLPLDSTRSVTAVTSRPLAQLDRAFAPGVLAPASKEAIHRKVEVATVAAMIAARHSLVMSNRRD